ncbi:hypothetical protein VKT23_003436 [Stygiomarasmius scandens]|uniref:F-box domain-containing protein n=1 Tax=Marasmiellus scandens TaxID=2682957 RepID=A0ABR1JZZ4_9AGAR
MRDLQPDGPSDRLPLDDDVLDRILMLCPSFSTLQSALLSSKSFYRVYKAHPRSIIRAVADNVTGSGLASEALKIAHYQIHGHSVCSSPINSASHPGEEIFPPFPTYGDEREPEMDNNAITPEVARRLTANGKVVKRLEDLFSLRYAPLKSSDKPNSWLIFYQDTKISIPGQAGLQRKNLAAFVEQCIVSCFIARSFIEIGIRDGCLKIPKNSRRFNIPDGNYLHDSLQMSSYRYIAYLYFWLS